MNITKNHLFVSSAAWTLAKQEDYATKLYRPYLDYIMLFLIVQYMAKEVAYVMQLRSLYDITFIE